MHNEHERLRDEGNDLGDLIKTTNALLARLYVLERVSATYVQRGAPIIEMRPECAAHLDASTYLYQQGDLAGGDLEFDAYLQCRGYP